MVLRRVAIALALATAWWSSDGGTGAGTIWQVGTFDGSSAEFAQGGPNQPVVFVVGQDRPSTGWYAFAPSVFPGKPSNANTAPRAIVFSIPDKPEPAYRLTASLIIEHSSVPAMRVGINGRTGLFYLHPKLDYAMGDVTAAFDPAYSRAEVTFDFPGSWLQSGRNQVTMQAGATGGEGGPGDGMDYDATRPPAHGPLPPRVALH